MTVSGPTSASRAVARFAASDGLGLAYSDEGEGMPVLCLAGLTRNMADFDPFADAAGTGVRLIRLDARGRGQSDHDANFHNYNIPREGRDAVDLLDHLGIARAVILGTSRGGMVAMALALTDRDRIAGVILNDIGPDIDPAGLARIGTYLGIRPGHAGYLAAAGALAKATAAEFPGVPLTVWRAFAERVWVARSDGLDLRYDPALRRAFLDARVPLPDLWAGLDALAGVPVAVIRGENSDILAHDTLSKMQQRRPGLITALVPDRGHVPFLDEPQSLAAIRAVLALAAA